MKNRKIVDCVCRTPSKCVVQDRKIECPVCGYATGITERGLMHRVVSTDIKCPKCGAVVIEAPRFLL